MDFESILREKLQDAYWIEFFFIEASLLENFVAGVLSLTLYETAYISEIVRGGVNSVAPGQKEAAQSLGLKKWHVFVFVIFPQALRNVLPSLTGQLITLIKESSILSIISIQELTFSSLQAIVSSKLHFEILILIAVIYFLLCFCLSLFSRKLEKRSLIK